MNWLKYFDRTFWRMTVGFLLIIVLSLIIVTALSYFAN